MLETIVLRYRNFDRDTDTINSHSELIQTVGHVWWGWWRKAKEPDHRMDLLEFQSRLNEKQKLEVGLLNRTTGRFSVAIVNQCVFEEDIADIRSPQPFATPSYYRMRPCAAWFRFRSIRDIDPAEFADRFSVPISAGSFFPVHREPNSDPKVIEPVVVSGVRRLRSDTVLHLSDIHFGEDFGFPQQQVPGKRPLLDILLQDIHRTNTNVGLVVVSGDLTCRGDANYLFSAATPFLNELTGRLNLTSDEVVIVPGNHDFSLDKFDTAYNHEAAFAAFLTGFYGSEREQTEFLRFETGSGTRIEVLTMNSVKLRDDESANYGWVDWPSCEQVLSRAGDSDGPVIRIAVLHHHLLSALREEPLPPPNYKYGSVSVTVNAGEIIEGLQRHGFNLVLHGHQHTPAVHSVGRGYMRDGFVDLTGLDQRLYVIGGGSAGVNQNRLSAEARMNCYGLLTLGDSDGLLQVRQYTEAGNPRVLFRAALDLRPRSEKAASSIG